MPIPETGRWSLEITLPWPPRVLHPNQAPRNLASTWGAKKRYRHACAVLTRAVAAEPAPAGRIKVDVEFRCPDRLPRDVLNLGMAIKAAVDGVADALEVNDRMFRPWSLDFGPVVAGGEVVLRLAAHDPVWVALD